MATTALEGRQTKVSGSVQDGANDGPPSRKLASQPGRTFGAFASLLQQLLDDVGVRLHRARVSALALGTRAGSGGNAPAASRRGRCCSPTGPRCRPQGTCARTPSHAGNPAAAAPGSPRCPAMWTRQGNTHIVRSSAPARLGGRGTRSGAQRCITVPSTRCTRARGCAESQAPETFEGEDYSARNADTQQVPRAARRFCAYGANTHQVQVRDEYGAELELLGAALALRRRRRALAWACRALVGRQRLSCRRSQRAGKQPHAPDERWLLLRRLRGRRAQRRDAGAPTATSCGTGGAQRRARRRCRQRARQRDAAVLDEHDRHGESAWNGGGRVWRLASPGRHNQDSFYSTPRSRRRAAQKISRAPRWSRTRPGPAACWLA